jgi:hypothetical protein
MTPETGRAAWGISPLGMVEGMRRRLAGGATSCRALAETEEDVFHSDVLGGGGEWKRKVGATREEKRVEV